MYFVVYPGPGVGEDLNGNQDCSPRRNQGFPFQVNLSQEVRDSLGRLTDEQSD